MHGCSLEGGMQTHAMEAHYSDCVIQLRGYCHILLFIVQMLLLRWRRLCQETRFASMIASWPVLTSHLPRVRITSRAWLQLPTTPGSTDQVWPSSQDRYTDNFLILDYLLIFCWKLYFQAFAKAFKSTPDDLDMHIVYDVSHNIAKVEEHISFTIHISFWLL